MMKVLPTFEKSQLKETAHYVSNALNNEAKRQMNKVSRVTSSSRDKNSDVLSTSVLKDLDTTMQPESSETDISVNSEDNDDDSEDQTASLIESDRQLDDSLTHLKQTVSAENVDNESSERKGTTSHNHDISKCCDICIINKKSKRKADMICCSICMSWYHEQCMGIEKSEPVGLWLCVSCRKVPQDIRSEISCLKDDVDNLKLSTNQILSTVNELATKLDNCIGGINDRITALNRQVSLHDMNITETLENLTSKTSNIKTSIDQKTSQILNKTSAVFEKVKTHEKNSNQHTNTQSNENNIDYPKIVDGSQNEKRLSNIRNNQRNPIQT